MGSALYVRSLHKKQSGHFTGKRYFTENGFYTSNFTNICDVACQNQAFVAEMSCSVIMFLGKNVTLAFI